MHPFYIMNIGKCTAREVLRCEPYEIVLTALDEKCNSLRVEVGQGEHRFEETVNVYDFVDIKQLIKAGKTMQDISNYSLLFLKLMISTAVTAKRISIIEAAGIPFAKLIRKK
jgi:hypothetical protein